mmetsp:Transcript_3481/g.12864  ORF Transcript_3481/g.12864 Transcript_3481/m.12864 type:complete len:306 (+) Transcript_3481:2216-3133(+)
MPSSSSFNCSAFAVAPLISRSAAFVTRPSSLVFFAASFVASDASLLASLLSASATLAAFSAPSSFFVRGVSWPGGKSTFLRFSASSFCAARDKRNLTTAAFAFFSDSFTSASAFLLAAADTFSSSFKESVRPFCLANISLKSVSRCAAASAAFNASAFATESTRSHFNLSSSAFLSLSTLDAVALAIAASAFSYCARSFSRMLASAAASSPSRVDGDSSGVSVKRGLSCGLAPNNSSSPNASASAALASFAACSTDAIFARRSLATTFSYIARRACAVSSCCFKSLSRSNASAARRAVLGNELSR